MRKTLTSLMVYLLIVLVSSASADMVGNIKSKPSYGRKTLVLSHTSREMITWSIS
jgi:hypothetical protein